VPAAAAYGASKAAVIHMLDSIRFELEPSGIAVTVVNPGFVKTPLTDRNPFPMPFLMPVDRAAEALVRGLEARRREVHFPKVFTLTLKFLRILPYPLYHRIMWRATRGRRLAKEATFDA
jgi:short-subunit dehydrogenase